jgi:hypothetical protein
MNKTRRYVGSLLFGCVVAAVALSINSWFGLQTPGMMICFLGGCMLGGYSERMYPDE